MSKNILNNSKKFINLSNTYKSDTNNQTVKKENTKLYDILKPILHDNTKLCKKHSSSLKIEERIESKMDSSIRLIFEEPKSKKIDNFIKTNVDKKFLCSLCECLLKDPLECYKCLKLFCNECIKKKLEEFKKCPTCFNIIFLDMMKSVDMENIDSYKLARVKCPFIGCKENLRLKEIEEHLPECIFQDMTENKKKNLNKLIVQNNSEDSLMKTHMLNYLRDVNKSLGKLNTNNLNETKPLKLEDLGFKSKLNNLKDQMTNLNDYTSKIIGEMTKITKITNTNLKNLINN